MSQFKKVIQQYYIKQPERQYNDMMLSASMLGGCPRVSYAKLRGVKATTPPGPGALQNFEVGNVTEAVIARALDRTGLLLHWWTDSQRYGATFQKIDWDGNLRDDQWVDEELFVKGTPDIVAQSPDKKSVVLIDVKTSSTHSMRIITRKLKNGTFWSEENGYRWQLGLYLLMAKRRLETGLEQFEVDYGKLIIIDKNNGSVIAEPTLFLDEALETEITNRLEYLKALMEGEEIPPCDCNVGWKKNFGTAYCSYGVLESMHKNKKGMLVPTRCCDAEYIINNCKENANTNS